jgi:hypothetical protein
MTPYSTLAILVQQGLLQV